MGATGEGPEAEAWAAIPSCYLLSLAEIRRSLTLTLVTVQLNTSNKTPLEFLSADPTMTFQGEGPNLVAAADLPDPIRSPMRRRSIKVDKPAALHLHTSRPLYEKNRCTITLTHGDPEDAGRNRRRTRKYLVASDLSTESLYAIQVGLFWLSPSSSGSPY